uniref:Neur_chan_LBD domain-containing protein n=1 Tax=Angiostrongylus cantonensis TaxID=6313 RepID=A0A0K0D4Y5_ANGCA
MATVFQWRASVCMCFEDVTKGLIWPCYPTNVWTVKGEIKWWNPNNYTTFPATDPPPVYATETEQAFGLLELRDKGAITTQTKENLIFLVAALPRETRRNLSYTLNEFVLRCSFNSKDCNMERWVFDFTHCTALRIHIQMNCEHYLKLYVLGQSRWFILFHGVFILSFTLYSFLSKKLIVRYTTRTIS